jgi:hypothetical protein
LALKLAAERFLDCPRRDVKVGGQLLDAVARLKTAHKYSGWDGPTGQDWATEGHMRIDHHCRGLLAILIDACERKQSDTVIEISTESTTPRAPLPAY